MRNLTKKFWTKRKIIIALIMSAVIAIGSFFIISCGGPKFNSKPDLEAIHGLASTSKPVPLDGTTPLDHDAKDNIYFAFNAMSKLSGFRTETSGTTTSMGIKQAIKAQRYVKGNEVFKQNVSHSSMAKVGTRTYVKGRNYVYQKAKAVESVNDVTWTVKAHGITEEKFLARYGFVANSITGYVMTDDTIISARQIGEPENGIYTFEYKLHTTDATGKVGLEMRTMANMESMPIFTSATLTVKMTSDWLVTQVKTSCKYKVNIKPLGAIDCVESITENFFDHGAVTQIPNAEFYQSFFGDGIDTPEEPVELTALDYVMTGFGEYIAGAKPLKASLTVTDENNAVSAKANAHIDLDIANLSTLSIKLDINQLSYDKISAKDIFLAYTDQTVYLKSGDFKGFGTLDQMGGLMAELLPLFNINTDGITSSFGSIDANALLAGANLIKTDGKAIVNIPISLSGIIADVNMIFNDGDTITIDKLTVKFGSITLNATPSDLITVSDIGDDYNNVATLFDVMDDNYNVKGEFSIGNLGGLVNFNAQTTDIDVIVDNTKIKLKNGVAYVNHNDLKVKLALDEIPSALESLSPIIGGVALPNLNESLESINALDLVSSILSSLKTTLTENTLTVYTTVKGIDFALVLGVSENGYTLNGVQTTIDGTDVNISFLSDVVETIKETELSEYNNILSLLDVIENNEINLNVNTFGLNLDVSVNLVDFTVLAKTEIYGKPLVAKFDGSKVYFSYLGLNAYVDINEIDQVLAKLTPIVGEVEIETPVTPSIEDVINNIVITENSISIKLFGLDVSVALNTTNNELTIKDIVVTSEDFSATATPSAKADYSALDGKTFYNILSVLDIIEDNEINLNVQAFDLDLDISVNLVDFTVLVKTEIYGKPLVAKFDGSKVYFSYLGLNAYVDINEIDTVLTKLTPIVGEVEIETPTTPSVEDVINNIVITENSISLKLFGLNVSILLNTTNNELTIKDIVVTSEDFSATATPSAKADYSALDGKTFYNILSVLDIIEDNGLIALDVEVAGVAMQVTFDAYQMKAYVGFDGIEAYIDLESKQIYARYPGVQAKLNIDEIESILNTLDPIINKFAPSGIPAINLDGVTDIDASNLISNITVKEIASKVVVNISLDGANVSITLNTKDERLTIEKITVTTDSVSINGAPTNSPNVYEFDTTASYIDLKALAETFTPSLETILTAESLTASMTASMIMDGALYEIKECKVNLKDIYGKTKVVADLKLVISAINADGTTTVKSEHVIHLVYQDPSLVADGEPNVYFTYDDTANIDVLKGTFTTTKAGETMEIVKQLYTAIPELQDALYPFLIPNDKGEPTMPSLGIDFKTLINGLIFNNGVLSADINGLALNKGLGSSIDLELIPTNDNLALNIPQASFNGIVLGVNATVGAPENGTFDDGIFTYTIDENTMDFSSINELLLTLKNTASYRSFQINAKVDVNAIGIINIEDKINIDIQIDVVNGKTYVKAKLTRAHYDLLGIQAWKDWEGSSTLYYNPENDMILVEHEYYKIKGSIIKRKGDFASHTESYSVKDFTADPLTKILSLIRFSSMIENTILDSTQKEKTSYATIDNSLKGYKYDTTNNKFSLTINLEPLMGDIKIVNVDIGHDANMILNSLSMQANVLGALNLKLNATLSSIGQYLGVDTEVKNQVANF